MRIAQSRLTSQGQVSVPAEVRRRLGLAPGSVLEWDAEGDVVLVRKGHRYSSDDIHGSLFPDGPPRPETLEALKNGIRAHIVKRHARG